MRSSWTHRRVVATAAAFILLAFNPAFAQHGGAGSAGGAGTAGSGVGSTSRMPGTTTTGTNGNSPFGSTGSSLSRPIFLSGKVLFDDGTPANTDIRIERVCGNTTRLEAHTDSKGEFSFQVGQDPTAFSDASENAGNTLGAPPNTGNNSTTYPGTNTSGSSRFGEPLFNCELRAVYPGFRSDVIDLSTRRFMDDPSVGTIILHRLVNVKGSTISVTTALAPKRAQKEFAKGSEAMQKGKMEEAEKDFTQATTLYPKFAIAWFALGQVQEREGSADSARASYIRASEADDKYVSPLDRLAFLSAHNGKWQDAADYSNKAIALNPEEFPSSFWCNALANYNLHKEAESEKSLNALLKLDTHHHYPEAENMLAQVLLDRGNYADAAVHLRAYLGNYLLD